MSASEAGLAEAEERAAVEVAAERIRAFARRRGRGSSYGFEGPTALAVLEAATGGFGPGTVRLARRALARAEGRAPGPEDPDGSADRGVAEVATNAAGVARPVAT